VHKIASENLLSLPSINFNYITYSFNRNVRSNIVVLSRIVDKILKINLNKVKVE